MKKETYFEFVKKLSEKSGKKFQDVLLDKNTKVLWK
jgi:hypothetical protein